MSKSNQGLRFNQNKLRWSLVDFESLKEFVKVLEFGAGKYTEKQYLCVESLKELCQNTAQTIQIEKLSPKDFVDLVTTNNLKSQIQSIKKDKDSTLILGLLKTQKKLKSTNVLDKDPIQQNKENRRKEGREKEHYLESMVSHQKSIIISSLKDVQSVDLKKGYTLITIIRLENFDLFCVANATKELDCLTMIFNWLQEQQIISKNIYLDNQYIVSSGANNWKKGLNREEILESALRHIIELIGDQEVDSESKLHHMGHVICNAVFYLYHHRNKSFSKERSNPFKNKDTKQLKKKAKRQLASK